jgi:hypothetical protein
MEIDQIEKQSRPVVLHPDDRNRTVLTNCSGTGDLNMSWEEVLVWICLFVVTADGRKHVACEWSFEHCPNLGLDTA